MWKLSLSISYTHESRVMAHNIHVIMRRRFVYKHTFDKTKQMSGAWNRDVLKCCPANKFFTNRVLLSNSNRPYKISVF